MFDRSGGRAGLLGSRSLQSRMTSPSSGNAASGPVGIGVGCVRVWSIAAAVFWGGWFFGVIDLLVLIPPDTRFYRHYLLETGWGLLYTMLVMLSLVFIAVRPTWRVFPQQLIVVAFAVLVTGLVTLAVGQVLVGAGLVITAIGSSLLAELPLRPVRGLSIRRVNPWLSILVVVSLVTAVIYAVRMIAAARAGVEDDNTRGLMHLPMQAAFGVALSGSAAITVLAAAASAPGWKLSAVPSAVAAVWIGVVSVVYPFHLGSLGKSGGIAAIVWGLAFAALALITNPRHRRDTAAEGSAHRTAP